MRISKEKSWIFSLTSFTQLMHRKCLHAKVRNLGLFVRYFSAKTT